MPETEVVLQKRPTAATLESASHRAMFPHYFDKKPASVRQEVMERTQSIPFSPYWRGVLEEFSYDAHSTGVVALGIFEAAERTNNETQLVQAAADNLADRFPSYVLEADIDLTVPVKDFAGNVPDGLAEFLTAAREDYESSVSRSSQALPVISDSWIGFARLLASRDPERHDQVLDDMIKARRVQEIRSEDAMAMDYGWGYDEGNARRDILGSIAPVLAKHFPRTVVSHLRAPQPSFVGASA